MTNETFETQEEQGDVARDGKENITESLDSEFSYLNLDTSALIDRNNQVIRAAIMDRYGIRVFDQEIENQIRQYQLEEQQRTEYYKTMVFLTETNLEDNQLRVIRNEVFSVSYVAARPIEIRMGNGVSWQNSWITVIMIFPVLMIGIVYGRFRKKERKKKLADINNRYDE